MARCAAAARLSDLHSEDGAERYGLTAASPRLRGKGWGEAELPRGRRQFDRRSVPLTPIALARNPTSPRKRGKVKTGGSS